MEAIKAYRPERNSFSNGQVLSSPYDNKKARVEIMEMADSMALKLVSLRLVTDQVIIYIGYDAENLTNETIRANYHGEIKANYYGKMVPKPAHGTANLPHPTSSTRLITEAVTRLYDEIVDNNLLIRRLNITVNNVIPEEKAIQEDSTIQLNLFIDYEQKRKQEEAEKKRLNKERRLQETQISIKKRFGKNSILRGLNFEEGATAKERNNQIGGHKA
jgi:DNA polymerase V